MPSKKVPKWFCVKDYPKGFFSSSVLGIDDDIDLRLDMVDRALLKRMGRKQPGLESMAYLYRRLGAPIKPRDDYKDLCYWIVGTPDVNVRATLVIGSIGLRFGYLVPDLFQEKIDAERGGKRKPYTKRVQKAIEALVEELCREVSIRDRRLTIFGFID